MTLASDQWFMMNFNEIHPNPQTLFEEAARGLAATLAYAFLIGILGFSGPAMAENGDEAAETAHVTITKGAQYQLCQEYARALTERQAPYRYCGVALPSGNPDFRLPEWEEVDPAAQFDLVRDIFYWTNATFNYLWNNRTFLDRQAYEPEIVPDMLEALWQPAKGDMERLVTEGKVKLQRSYLDINFDGKAEPVYRMTPIYVKTPASGNPSYPGLDVRDRSCRPANLLGDEQDFVYFVRRKDSLYPHTSLRRHGLWPGMRLFYWRGRIYWLFDSQISEPTTTPTIGGPGNFVAKSVCGYRFEKIEQSD